MLVVGPNGAGKTNLLESLHVGTQGFSPRTRADAQLVRFGEQAGRVGLRGRRGESAVELEVTLELGEGKKAKLNGAALRAAEQLRSEIATLVFTPDRLAVVKGGPAVRRAYFDRVIGRLTPARAPLTVDYAAAVAQRNAALRRLQRLFVARCNRTMDGAGRDPRPAARRSPNRSGRPPGCRFRGSCRGARIACCAHELRRRAADHGSAGGPARA